MSRHQRHRPATDQGSVSGVQASLAEKHGPGELHLLTTHTARTPNLVLVTPGELGPDEPSRGLVKAIVELHRAFIERAHNLTRQTRGAQGDAVETAKLLGRLDAYADAARLSEEIIARFGLRDPYGWWQKTGRSTQTPPSTRPRPS